MPEIYLLGGHMKDMKDRVRRAISAVAVREHWRMRRVLLLVMVAVTVLGMVTVSSMGRRGAAAAGVCGAYRRRRNGDHLRPSQPEHELRHSGDPGGLQRQGGPAAAAAWSQRHRDRRGGDPHRADPAAKRWTICSTGCIWSPSRTRWCSST